MYKHIFISFISYTIWHIVYYVNSRDYSENRIKFQHYEILNEIIANIFNSWYYIDFNIKYTTEVRKFYFIFTEMSEIIVHM